MTTGFPRMNSKQRELCPTGYLFITNITYNSDRWLTIFGYMTYMESCHHILSEYRKRYGDVQTVSPSYDSLGREQSDTVVALYVPNPALRRIQKWLRNHGKLTPKLQS